jgi:leucyl aminopeptidase
VLVSGEEDNVYVPGHDDDDDDDDPPPPAWSGMSESGTVAKGAEDHYQTATKLARGTYLFTLSGDNDADLYVRIGSAPTSTLYDCRPYKSGSAESCKVELNTAARVHVMVRGWATSSSYTLTGKVQD